MDITKLAEIEWPFEDLDVNTRFCIEHANFSHKDACEFIIHIGSDLKKDGITYVEFTVRLMKSFGCTKDFIKAYEQAAKSGALRVLFYAP